MLRLWVGSGASVKEFEAAARFLARVQQTHMVGTFGRVDAQPITDRALRLPAAESVAQSPRPACLADREEKPEHDMIGMSALRQVRQRGGSQLFSLFHQLAPLF